MQEAKEKRSKMKLSQEEFDKLPQLDRIEFRQKINNLKSTNINKKIIHKVAILGIIKRSLDIISIGTFP